MLELIGMMAASAVLVVAGNALKTRAAGRVAIAAGLALAAITFLYPLIVLIAAVFGFVDD